MRPLNLIVVLVSSMFVLNAQNNDFESCKYVNKYQYSNQSLKLTNSPLMENYDVKYYKLDVATNNLNINISGNVSIMAQVETNNLDTFVFDLINTLTVDSIIIEGNNQSFSHTNNLVYTYLSSSIPMGSLFTAIIYYHGTSSGGGMSNGTSGTWGNQVTWTLSESFHAKDWFPVKEDLRDKADSSDVSITVPNNLMAGSNGILTSVDTLLGYLKYNWKERYPIDYYLISIAIAEYVEYDIYAHPNGTADSLLIQNFVYNNPYCLPYFQSTIEETPGLIETFSDIFGLYPFINEKYGHCMAPINGGMEHQTMTTLGFFDFGLIAHELAHMWFGDNVTCQTWQDIWINEGFASYGAYLAEAYIHTQQDAVNWMSTAHSDAMQTPDGSIYVPFQDAFDENRIFSSQLSYKKGASMVHMIRFEMQNDSLFFTTLKQFQQIYKESTATGDDFMNVANAVSGMDFTQFFNQWYYGEGYPTYNIYYQQINDTLHFTADQLVSSTTPLFKMLMQYKITYVGGDTTVLVYQNTNSDYFSFYIPHQITGIIVDPNDWVLDGTPTVVNITSEYLSSNVNIYPNPASTLVNIENSKFKEASIAIYDIYGNIVKKPLLFIGTTYETIDVSHLTNGIYIVKIQSEKGTVIKKIIKSNTEN